MLWLINLKCSIDKLQTFESTINRNLYYQKHLDSNSKSYTPRGKITRCKNSEADRGREVIS